MRFGSRPRSDGSTDGRSSKDVTDECAKAGSGLPRTRPETARYAPAAYQFRLDFFNEDTDFGGFSRPGLCTRRRDRRGARGPRRPARRQLPDRPAERSAEKPRLPAAADRQVRVNGKRAKPDVRLAAGDR